MRKYFDVVFYTTSIPAAGALVFVTDAGGNLAQLYSDNGVTPTTNPVRTDSTGFYSFFVADGTYTLQYMVQQTALRTLTNVQIYDESTIPDISHISTVVTEIENGTAPSAGALNGTETFPVSRGGGLLQTTTGAEAAFAIAPLAVSNDVTKGAALVGFDGGSLSSFFLSKNERVVDSIALLRQLVKTTYTRAFVTGYYSAGDGGGGSYYLDASDSTSTDNGGTVIVASDGGRWKLELLTSTVSVRQFGAKGDGTTDDALAINNSVVATAVKGGTVYFPAGNYLIASTIQMKPNVSIKGAGQITSKIFTNLNISILNFSEVSTYGIQVEDLYIYGTGNAASVGIFVGSTPEQSAHMRLKNLRIENCGYGLACGTSVFALFDSYIEKVDFISNTTAGCQIAGSQVTMVGCSFRLNNWGLVIRTEDASSIGGPRILGGTWVQNSFDVIFDGVYIRPTLFSGCWMEQCTSSVIGATGSTAIYHASTVFDGCLFQPGATSTGTGVFNLNNTNGIFTFTNCTTYKDLNASATLPDAADSRFAGAVYRRESCTTITGSSLTILKDCTNNSELNFVNIFVNRKYANDAAAGAAGLVQGDIYYNTTIPALSLKN